MKSIFLHKQRLETNLLYTNGKWIWNTAIQSNRNKKKERENQQQQKKELISQNREKHW